MTRVPTLAPQVQPAMFHLPTTARAMDKADIRAFRGWQRDAARRAKQAGFDIVHVYAGHDYLPFQFLSRRTNTRGDTYGGSLENRARLGDCLAPSSIADAIYSAHRFARFLGEPDPPPRRERPNHRSE